MLFRTLCFLFALCTSPLLAQGPHLLRLEPPGMDVSAVLKTIADEKLPVGGIIIDVARSGQTLFPVPDSPYITRAGFEDGTQLTRWIDEIHAQGLKAYAGVNLLRWWLLFSEDPNPFERVPELLELDSSLSCSDELDAKYASMWHPKVRAGLVALMRELATRYPGFDGLYLQAQFSRTAYLGFSDDARIAYIRNAHIDPVDLPLYGVDEFQDKYLLAYFEWRPKQLTELVREVVGAYREIAGADDRVIAMATATGPARRPRHRATPGDDWVTWLLEGLASDLAFEASVWLDGWPGMFRAGLDTFGRLRTPAPTYLIVSGEQRGVLSPIADVYSALGQGDISGLPLLVSPYAPSQLDGSLDLLRSLR